MPLTVQELLDKAEINETLLAYSTALDVPGRRWDKWYEAFAADAVCEFSALGPKSPAELQQIFKQNDATRLTTQHLILNVVIDLEGDKASSRSECFYAAVNRGETEGKNQLRLSGVFFLDELERRSEGWRITHRVAHSRWSTTQEIDA